MKIACVDAIVPGNNLIEKARNLSDWGFDGIEVFLELSPGLSAELEQLKRLHAATAIRPCALSLRAPSTARVPGQDTDASRLKAEEVVRKSIELSSEIGVPTITVFEYGARQVLPWSNPHPPMPPDLRSEFVSMLRELARAAEYRGGLLLLEPINRYESRYVTTLAEAVGIVREIGSEHLGVMADFFHMSLEEPDIPKSIAEAGDWIKHVHLSDSDRFLPGHGHTDFAAAFRALRRTGFHGYMSLECYVVKGAEDELAGCASYVRQCWDSA